MSKRYGLSRRYSSKKLRLDGSQFVLQSQISLNRSSPSPPLIEDDNFNADTTHVRLNVSPVISRENKKKSSFLQLDEQPTQSVLSKTYFQQVLEQNEIIFNTKDDILKTTIEAKSIIKKLEKHFKNDQDFPYNVDEFLSSFKKYITNTDKFKMLMTSSILLLKESSSQLEQEQISVLKMLLRIDFMQSKLINILVDELSNYVVQDNIADQMYWIKSILEQLRNLDFYGDGEELLKNLIAIIETSGDNEIAQHEIICSLLKIIPEQHHNTVALELSRILKDNFSLCSSILDNLENLSISSNVRQQLDNQVLELLKADCPLNKMHNITKYLMRYCNENNVRNIIQRLRENLDWGSLLNSTDDNFKSECYTSQVLTFNIIRDSMPRTILLDSWSKLIFSYQSYRDIMPLDIVILFFLCVTPHKHEQYVLTMISKRITEGILRPKVLEKAFKDFYPVFKDNFQQFTILFMKLLKNKIKTVSEFGGLCYKFYIVYQEETKNAPAYSSHVTKTVLIDLVQLVKFSEITCTSVLTVISDLCMDHVQSLCHNSVLLYKLLYSIHSMTLIQVRMAINILCCAAYPLKDQNSGFSLQDDIRIYIPKWLSSDIILERKKGIICCIATAQHIGNIERANDDKSNFSFETIDDMPEGKIKDAALLIESMLTIMIDYPSLQGLAYDELSFMMCSHKFVFNNQIISWLCNKITNDFEQYFTVESVDNVLNGCKIEEQYCINDSMGNNRRVIINIASLAFKGNYNYSRANIIVLSPLFRLLRILHKIQYNDNLSFVNGVLGYAIAMPVLDDDDDFEEVSYDERQFVLDSFFHCINWLRECLSAFVDIPQMEKKIIKRLKLVVEMEKRFSKLLSLSGLDYKPPLSNFYTESVEEISVNKKNTKIDYKKNKNKNQNQTNTLQGTTIEVQTEKRNIKVVEDQSGNIFREYDVKIIILLKTKLDLTNSDALAMDEMMYLLRNVIDKFEFLTGKNKKIIQNMSSWNQNNLIKQLVPIIPDILVNFNLISDVINDALKNCDNIKDAHIMYFDKTMQAKNCLLLLLKLFSQLFDWDGFTTWINKNLFKELLLGFIGKDKSSESIKNLVVSLVNFFIECKSFIVTLPCAASLIKILNSLLNYTDDADVEIRLIELSREFLSEEWYDATGVVEKGRQSNIYLEMLIKTYFRNADVKKIVQNVNWIKEEVLSSNKKFFTLKTFPCFLKSNFPVLYKNVFYAFVEAVQNRILKPLSCTQHLRFWEAIMNTLGKLLCIAKELEIKTIVNIFIKQATFILKIFLKQGITGLEASLKTNAEDVTNILKTMQHSTRFINSICVQAKTAKDVTLMAYVPKVLQILESIVYRVKAVLVANNCSSVFIMGNLINRNVKGDIIPSQSSSVTESNKESENDILSDTSEPDLDLDSEDDQKLEENTTKTRSKLY